MLYEESDRSLNVRGVFLHALADAVSSIGLLLAALAVFFLNWPRADAIASLWVALFILEHSQNWVEVRFMLFLRFNSLTAKNPLSIKEQSFCFSPVKCDRAPEPTFPPQLTPIDADLALD
ncbi:MAG: cation transporter [Cyanobacteriota bacterium]|nr:cation transporter [Cyanobacteriota bacterium]